MMYLIWPWIFSVQLASQVTVLSCWTFFHLWPLGGCGHWESLLQLMMTSSGIVLLLIMPCLGCSPRPRNNPGGSILKLPIFSLCPSIMQNPYSSTILSLFSFSAFFSSLERFFLSSDTFLKCSLILEKSHLLRSLIFSFSFSVIHLRQSLKKFLLKTSLVV